ncbi:BREX-1 system adenine-specific DNA-methyltransferase PglX [Lachnospiraceae bacterium Oil+RF-744-WCA-WT-11]|uniref:site-specific DNA-methyltransferase (adenine-specific) n=2 Tax=Porcincola intestinalis TaxID=2606632 RepID=A0A6L5X990_9FIRM|nr:BREX-1 system adenine-specific DNA-methyltransferase PglX [Porcincola intestinalis]
MDKTNIKNFAIWARKKLIADSIYKASLLGISEKGIEEPLPQSTNDTQLFDIGMKEPYAITGQEIGQRKKLVEAIRKKERNLKYKDAFQSVMEEVAYTWFNRLIAIRFMEVNDYLPSRVRVLSSDNPGKTEPDLVTTPFDSDLLFSEKEKQQIIDWKNANKIDDVFRMLFIKQCNALNNCLPMLFERISDYTELLLNVSVTDRDGILWHLIHDIPEKNFDVNAIDDDGKPAGQVEIIGWFYQYYISEKHDSVVDPLHGKVVEKEDIPAATQLFTTDWVVRYIIDNSVGRYWIERNPSSNLRNKLEYFVAPKTGNIKFVDEKITPEDLTVFDPCMGSAHFGVYAFDVLEQIYQECGYSERDAAASIVKNNLFGLDIDKRAAQLASFAITMKAMQYDKRFLKRHIYPHFYEIKESNGINPNTVDYFVNGDESLKQDMQSIIHDLHDAKEYGSILQINPVNFDAMFARFAEIEDVSSLGKIDAFDTLLPLVREAKVLSDKYTVVATNPPYLNKFNAKLKKYIVDNYADYKGDLFSVFICRNFGLCTMNGYSGFMTPMVWMFIKTYEPLRNYVLKNKAITTLIQFEYSVFEEATVPICSFVLKNGKANGDGEYFRLSDFTGGMEVQRRKVEEALANPDCGFFYESSQHNFSKIPGSPVAYWASKQVLKDFEDNPIIDKVFETRNGMSTTNNNKFLRNWFECDYTKCGLGQYSAQTANESGKKWFRYNKGGEFRRWYGNNQYLVNWYKDGEELKAYVVERYGSYSKEIRSEDRYFFESITWSGITSSQTGFRFSPKGALFDSGANGLFASDDINLKYLLGFLNSKLVIELIRFINPTINTGSGTVGSLPIIVNNKYKEGINRTVNESIQISQTDWDSFEASWDFQRHPLIRNTCTIKEAFTQWQSECDDRFNRLKANEEELNRIFIDIYGFQDELTPEEEDKDVTVRKADLGRDIRSFVSYAVGCMVGRYSLDADGLAYAGGDWDASKYKTFIPDRDAIIPITDEEYLDDDIVGRFVRFVKVVYGDKTLEENLTFIADALGGKGKSSREVIRNYFLRDFFKDHCKTYQKRPIYWLYDSGKQNGFKALVYLHRMDENTTGKVRADYLHHIEQIYSNEAARMQDTMERSKSAHEVSVAEKQLEKLKKQIKECQDYDAKLGHLALDQIRLNLDDGVKVNYRKAQTGRNGKFYEVFADSKNIMANDALWKEYLTEWPHEEE